MNESLLSYIKMLDLSADNLCYIQQLIIKNHIPLTSPDDVTSALCYIPPYDSFVVSGFVALISIISSSRYFFNRIKSHSGEIVFYGSSVQPKVAVYLTITLSEMLTKHASNQQYNRTQNYKNVMCYWIDWIIETRTRLDCAYQPECHILDTWLRQHLSPGDKS